MKRLSKSSTRLAIAAPLASLALLPLLGALFVVPAAQATYASSQAVDPAAQADPPPYRRCVAKQNIFWQAYGDNCDGWKIAIENASSHALTADAKNAWVNGLSSSKPFVSVKSRDSAALDGRIAPFGGPGYVTVKYSTKDAAYRAPEYRDPAYRLSGQRILEIGEGDKGRPTVSCGFTQKVSTDYWHDQRSFAGVGCDVKSDRYRLHDGSWILGNYKEPVSVTFRDITAEETARMAEEWESAPRLYPGG